MNELNNEGIRGDHAGSPVRLAQCFGSAGTGIESCQYRIAEAPFDIFVCTVVADQEDPDGRVSWQCSQGKLPGYCYLPGSRHKYLRAFLHQAHWD
jgi:hypothetical protein